MSATGADPATERATHLRAIYRAKEIDDALTVLAHAHHHMDEHPDNYPPRPCRPILDGVPL